MRSTSYEITSPVRTGRVIHLRWSVAPYGRIVHGTARHILQLLVGESLTILVVVSLLVVASLVVVSHVRPLSWVGVDPSIRFLSRIGQKNIRQLHTTPRYSYKHAYDME